MNECSDIFEEIFHDGCCGIVRTCRCGVTHFNTADPQFYDKGELEDLLKKQEAEPDKYIARDCSVGYIEFFGCQVVRGCNCSLAWKMEQRLLGELHQILAYAKRIAAKKREEVQKLENALEGSDHGGDAAN